MTAERTRLSESPAALRPAANRLSESEVTNLAMLPIGLALSCAWAAAGPPPSLVPELKGKQRDPTKIGHQSVEIHLPWEAAGCLELRFPETLRCNLGLLFIDHVRADMPPVVRVERLPDWVKDDETGAVSYELPLPNGVTFGALATPADGRVDLEFWVRNGTDQPLTRLHTQFCLVQTRAAPFSEGSLTRTFIHSDGKWLALADTTHEVMNPDRGPWIITAVGDRGAKPHTKLEGCWYCCPERGDARIIATTDPEGRRVVGISWDDGAGLMSNGWIPCLHNDPPWPPECPPGETVSVRGRIYIVEDGLEGLWERVTQDQPPD